MTKQMTPGYERYLKIRKDLSILGDIRSFVKRNAFAAFPANSGKVVICSWNTSNDTVGKFISEVPFSDITQGLHDLVRLYSGYSGNYPKVHNFREIDDDELQEILDADSTEGQPMTKSTSPGYERFHQLKRSINAKTKLKMLNRSTAFYAVTEGSTRAMICIWNRKTDNVTTIISLVPVERLGGDMLDIAMDYSTRFSHGDYHVTGNFRIMQPIEFETLFNADIPEGDQGKIDQVLINSDRLVDSGSDFEKFYMLRNRAAGTRLNVRDISEREFQIDTHIGTLIILRPKAGLSSIRDVLILNHTPNRSSRVCSSIGGTLRVENIKEVYSISDEIDLQTCILMSENEFIAFTGCYMKVNYTTFSDIGAIGKSRVTEIKTPDNKSESIDSEQTLLTAIKEYQEKHSFVSYIFKPDLISETKFKSGAVAFFKEDREAYIYSISAEGLVFQCIVSSDLVRRILDEVIELYKENK